MRAQTKKKHEMGKRFAILIGVAAVGVMALGAQTGAQTQAPTPPPPTCKGLAATIVGTEGPDGVPLRNDSPPLKGTPGRDVIVGLGGGDFLFGRAGNDVICGGDGRDFFTGDKGNDTLLGQAGSDIFGAGKGKDRCEGGKGNDTKFTEGGKWDPVCEVEKSIEKVDATLH
jgi:Ca2+-binding RTX toxin-like protein